MHFSSEGMFQCIIPSYISLRLITDDVKVVSAGCFHCDITNFLFAIYKFLGRYTLGLYKYHRLEEI